MKEAQGSQKRTTINELIVVQADAALSSGIECGKQIPMTGPLLSVVKLMNSEGSLFSKAKIMMNYKRVA